MDDKFSVIMSVYKKDNAIDVKQAVESIYYSQTLKPNEIIMIVDGPVPDALKNQIINLAYDIHCLKTHWLTENGGLGNALRIGVELASNELIVRMDSDDISLPYRFASQVAFLQCNPDISIVGGQISEFIDNPNNIVGKREVPLTHSKLVAYTKMRCPFNHMTVMFRKEAIMRAGNYISWFWNEDYYLWVRMAQAGCRFANLPETLVNVRVGKDMYARRGGWRYFRSEEGIQRYMLRHGMVGLPRYLINVAIRFAVQVAMPNRLRGFVFQKLFRK